MKASGQHYCLRSIPVAPTIFAHNRLNAGGPILLSSTGDCQQTDSFVVRHALPMKLGFTRWAIGAAAALAVTIPVAAYADDDGDHDLVREVYEHGEIHGLHDLIAIVRAHTPGDIVAIRLFQVGDKWVYRFQVIAIDGRRTTLK